MSGCFFETRCISSSELQTYSVKLMGEMFVFARKDFHPLNGLRSPGTPFNDNNWSSYAINFLIALTCALIF